jgi:hypothetical protein
MVLGTHRTLRTGVDVSDRIVLTIPAGARFRSVATLVIGGIGGRADLPYERMDDLQLAVLSILDATDRDTVTLDVQSDRDGLAVAVGPVRDGSGDDDGLQRVLSRLVEGVAHEDRDGAEWITFGISNANHGSAT